MNTLFHEQQSRPKVRHCHLNKYQRECLQGTSNIDNDRPQTKVGMGQEGVAFGSGVGKHIPLIAFHFCLSLFSLSSLSFSLLHHGDITIDKEHTGSAKETGGS